MILNLFGKINPTSDLWNMEEGDTGSEKKLSYFWRIKQETFFREATICQQRLMVKTINLINKFFSLIDGQSLRYPFFELYKIFR